MKQLQRQLNQEIQNAASAKRELNDYQLRMSRLQDEINTLKLDKEQSNSLISSLQQRVKFCYFNIHQIMCFLSQLMNEEDLNTNLRTEIQELEDRVQEIDRLKSLEDLIQSQRWDDISQMAQTMQSVSRTMARATSPTTIRKRVELK